MKIQGYRRPNGSFGIRNKVLIFPTVICAATVAQMISRQVPDSVFVTHTHGCGHMGEEKDHMIRTMAGFCCNPNVTGVLLIGLGCELITPELIAKELNTAGQNFKMVSIQSEGGITNTVNTGKKLAQELLLEANRAKREQCDISELVMGVKCGASDTLSGLTANPALGVACDRLINEGGTVIMSETVEMLGAEQVLARRAADDKVKRRILEMTAAKEASINMVGVDVRGAEPSPGNMEGGITTLEEKSLGAIRKGGTSNINEVINYAESPSRRGLVLMDGPAHDAVCITGMAASGAQLIAFTTGRGTPLGSAIAPVIKISSNSTSYQRMADNTDINAGVIIDAGKSIGDTGDKIFEEITNVASGKLTRSEVGGFAEFAIHSITPTL